MSGVTPMAKGEIHDHESSHPPLPGHKAHSCTDGGCLVLYLLSLVGLGYVMSYAYQNGDFRSLSTGYNYEGQRCGSADETGAYAFWCLDETGEHLSWEYPICVESCPTSNATMSSCFDPATQQTTQIMDYRTTRMMGYCMPTDEKIMQEALEQLGGNGTSGMVVRAARASYHGSVPLLIAMLVSIIVGYMYIFLLEHCAECLVRVCLIILVVGPLGIGGYFLYAWRTGGATAGILGETGTGDSQTDLIAGGGFVVLGLVMSIVACCFHTGLDTAVACMESACECMFEEPTLLLEPFISLALKGGLFVVMMAGFMLLVSTGQVHKAGAMGVGRSLDFSNEQYAYMGYYAFMVIWIMEMCNSTSQYVLSWTTQMWYFTPYIGGQKLDAPTCGICKGYCNAIRYHLGTLAFGSFLIAFFRGLRMALGVLVSASKETGNPIGVCVGKACICFISCFERFLAFLNKNAYMDVAITSKNFCSAAASAIDIMENEVPAIAILNGAQLVFQVCGIGIITFAGFFVTWVLLKKGPDFFDIPDPYPVAAMAGVVSFVIGLNFMVVFDTVGDTILYCFGCEQRRHNNVDAGKYGDRPHSADSGGSGMFGFFFGGAPEDDIPDDEHVNYAPPRLRNLIAQHHDEMGYASS